MSLRTSLCSSHIARHNLIQMAQILQVLAISQWEKIDSRVMDLYGKFEKVTGQIIIVTDCSHIDQKGPSSHRCLKFVLGPLIF
ncbi:hypothetical protein DPMN_146358 [Dreissena polymorpha]|uniref:Uncharacterized protein n=1 Tax=Dreissena polymorpha TaxID=45954 RepID=A0A9D4J1X0_DREPO|nr:hypothetical protein DPMN_146358 [Dreissena polymorpha]